MFPGAKVRFAKYIGSAPYLTRNELVLYQNLPATSDPVALEAYDGDFQEINVVTEYVHVPVEVPCEDDGGCCGNCNAKPRARLDWGVLAIAVLVVLRRRRRR